MFDERGPGAERHLRVEDLSIDYASRDGTVSRALDGISFGVGPHETVGIVGESGCGKSTLALALLGHLRPGGRVAAGRVMVDGADVLSLEPGPLAAFRQGRLAIMPQNPHQALTPHIRVGPQVREGLGAGSAGAARGRVLELFETTGLPDPEAIYERYPHELSGGQRQRVVLAATIAQEPSTVILDEPTTALDKTTEIRVLRLISDLVARIGARLIYISHDLPRSRGWPSA